jgi:peptidoglycan/xylan/chitin deacetylase (PgdA/CDA1 family)
MKATLTYHSIDDSGSPISLPPAAFRDHLRWFESGRVRVLPLDDLVSDAGASGDAVAVTFDDGFMNTHDAVASLRAASLPVTLFLVSRAVGGTTAWRGRAQPGIPTLPLLGWPEIERLVARGASVAAHSRTHAALTRLDDGALDDELEGGLDDLQSRLGTRPAHIAYPYGEVNAHVATRAARYYRFGHTTEFRSLNAREDPARLPRLDMYYFRSAGALDQFGTPAFGRAIARCHLRRRIRAGLRRPGQLLAAGRKV